MGALVFAVLLLPLLAHGLAHYGAARACGVRPKLWTSLIPCVGCAHVARHRRIVPVLAGPVASYVAAAAIKFGILFGTGAATGTVWYKIAGASEGSDAEGKLSPGDRILQLDDRVVYDIYDGYAQPPLTQVLADVLEYPGDSVDIRVLRDGEEIVVPVTPIRDGDRYRIGIMLDARGDIERAPLQLGVSLRSAAVFPAIQVRELFRTREGQLMGPVGITSAVEAPPSWIDHLESAAYASVIVGFVLLLVDLGAFAVALALRRGR